MYIMYYLYSAVKRGRKSSGNRFCRRHLRRDRPLTFVTASVTWSPFAYRGASTGDSRLMERMRFVRAGLVTPLPGGLGIVPAGMTTGARGAPLKRDRRRG
jgi:hypothetical protein